MADIRWSNLDPITQRHLTMLSEARNGLLCGCTHKHDDYWRLCQYHEGVDDGAEAARAGVDRIHAAEVAEHLLRADSLRAELARCQAENERMEAAVQAVRDLHCKATDEDDHDWCEECADLSDGEMSYWPCSTIVTLDAALGGERDE